MELNILKHRTFFLLLQAILTTILLLSILVSGSISIFINLHHFTHTNFLDFFFEIITFFGNGVFAIMLSLVFALKKRWLPWAIQLSFSFILSGILVQIVKRIFHSPRPKVLLHQSQWATFLDTANTGFNSFPSGHSATAFALATILCAIHKNIKWQVFIFFIACLVSYSRVYLGHHFVEDIVVGSLLGTSTSLVTLYYISKAMKKKEAKVKLNLTL